MYIYIDIDIDIDIADDNDAHRTEEVTEGRLTVRLSHIGLSSRIYLYIYI